MIRYFLIFQKNINKILTSFLISIIGHREPQRIVYEINLCGSLLIDPLWPNHFQNNFVLKCITFSFFWGNAESYYLSPQSYHLQFSHHQYSWQNPAFLSCQLTFAYTTLLHIP